MRIKPTLFLVDDHVGFRNGLKLIMRLENIATVIGEASNGQECMDFLLNTKPDLILMDIEMPIMNGLETTKKAIELMPDVKIMAYTMFESEEYFIKMVELGAKGFLLKSMGINELEKAINIINNGGEYFQYTKKIFYNHHVY